MRAYVTRLLSILLLLALGAVTARAQPPHDVRYAKSNRVPEQTEEKSDNERVYYLGGHVAPRSPEIPEDAPPIVHFFYWLGNFHPPMVNFPIALFVAAGVAELLLMFGARPSLASASRFCLWFAVIAGAITGILGWLFAGFDISERPELLQTHYWLGSAAVIWAVIVLVIGELRFRRDSRGLRVLYRLMLLLAVGLVLATGFYGGAMIYGLDHYQWSEGSSTEAQDQPTDSADEAAAAPAATVKMTGELTFEPRQVTITAGQTILWTNPSDGMHTVTANKELASSPENVDLPKGAEPFNSGEVTAGQRYKHRFPVPGHYKYVCLPHEAMGMIGEVVVKPKKRDGG